MSTDATTATAAPPAATPDLRPQLLQAFDVCADLVDAAAVADLDQPTPCTEFDLRTLLAHLQTVVRRIRIVLAGGHFAEVGQTTEVPDDDIADSFRDALAELAAMLPDVDLSVPVAFPFGTVPSAAGVASYVGEVTAHSWDVAVTIDRRDLLAGLADLAGPLLAAAQQRFPASGRAEIPFDDAVAVPDDAPALDRYVAWMGRDPRWVPAA